MSTSNSNSSTNGGKDPVVLATQPTLDSTLEITAQRLQSLQASQLALVTQLNALTASKWINIPRYLGFYSIVLVRCHDVLKSPLCDVNWLWTLELENYNSSTIPPDITETIEKIHQSRKRLAAINSTLHTVQSRLIKIKERLKTQ